MRGILLLFLLSAQGVCSQARMVINGDAYIVVDGAAKVVIENSASNAVSSTGAGGVITESEFDQVKWMVGSSTGLYIMPFVATPALNSIPFKFDITSAGTGAGFINFSTIKGGSWDNSTFMPSDVTHVSDYNTGSVNNSGKVIDRFWVIDPVGYGVKPAGDFTFKYDDSDISQGGNSIVEANLMIQRFNSTLGMWGDFLPVGFINVTTNEIGTPVSSNDFFRSWTLVDATSPLPVVLEYFNVTCDKNELKLEWKTLSEANVDHFDLWYNENGNLPKFVTDILPKGSGGQLYSFYSNERNSGLYELYEVTLDGDSVLLDVKSAVCNENEQTWAYGDADFNQLIVGLFSTRKESFDLLLYDLSGRLVTHKVLDIGVGSNLITVSDVALSSGIYLLEIYRTTKKETIKIMVR